MASETPTSPFGFDFDAFRAARFGAGVACPHCGARRVQRWGGFRGRQRFRCRSCPRTFSDFTATPLAHLKRVDRVLDYLGCMERSLTIRRTAAVVAIDPCTAFRWRHRFLNAFRAGDRRLLNGEVVVGYLRFRYCDKGRGPPSAPVGGPAERGPATVEVWRTAPGQPVTAESWMAAETARADRPAGRKAARALVIVARDRADGVAAGVVGWGQARPQAIAATLGERLASPVRIATGEGPFGELARWGRGVGGFVRWASSRELEPIASYGRDLRRWLVRFRGVATWYLDHYLTWHGLLLSRPPASRRGGGAWCSGLPRLSFDRLSESVGTPDTAEMESGAR